MFWQKKKKKGKKNPEKLQFFFKLQDLCPVPERTAWQWCLNLFVSELTHSALYTLIHRWREKMFYAYTRVFVCIYIYTVTDMDTWMLRWLSWSVFFLLLFFLCEYLYTVEQINKKNEAKVSSVQSIKNCLWVIILLWHSRFQSDQTLSLCPNQAWLAWRIAINHKGPIGALSYWQLPRAEAKNKKIKTKQNDKRYLFSSMISARRASKISPHLAHPS